MQTFSVRDLRDRTGELIREAEAGVPAMDYPAEALDQELAALDTLGPRG
jgi:hypothetical protein